MGINVNYNLTIASAHSLCGFRFVRPNWDTKNKNRGQLEESQWASRESEDHLV
jgi:hypothetical protein